MRAVGDVSSLNAAVAGLFAPCVGVGTEETGDRAARRTTATRAALLAAGGPAVEPGRARTAEPVWPAGWTGSISHAGDTTVAVAAPSSYADGLGVDVEVDEPPGERFAHRVCTPAEWSAIGARVGPGADAERLALVVFSAKESVFKALFPTSRDAVGLKRVEVALGEGMFRARLAAAVGPFLPGFAVEGGWCRTGRLVLTGVRFSQRIPTDAGNLRGVSGTGLG